MPVVDDAIAIIDHRQRVERIAPQRILRIAVEDRGSPADRLRPETRTWPVRRCRIERDAKNGCIHAGKFPAISPPHK